MWQLYVLSFLAGFFGVNGLPHFVKGVAGEKWGTQYSSKPSSPLMNALWGWLNLVVAGLLLYEAGVHAHLLRAFALVALGALAAALVLAYPWATAGNRR